MEEGTSNQLVTSVIQGDVSRFSALLDHQPKLQEYLGCSEEGDFRPTEHFSFSAPLIHLAVQNGQMEMFHHLLSLNPNMIHYQDDNGESCLAYACQSGHVEMIKAIVAVDSEQLHRKDEEMREPIHHACEAGHLEVVQELVDIDPAALNVVTGDGDNLLHLAAQSGSEPLVRWLLEQSQAKEWRSQEGMFGQPWERALFFEHEDIATYILKDQPEDSIPRTTVAEPLGAVVESSPATATALLNTPLVAGLAKAGKQLGDLDEIIEICTSAMEHDDLEMLGKIESLLQLPPEESLSEEALVAGRHNIIRELWAMARLDVVDFMFPVIWPDVAAFYLCYPDHPVEYCKRFLSLVSWPQLEVVQMLLEGDYKEAITRLLGEFPPWWEKNVTEALQSRKEEFGHLILATLGKIATTPSSGDRPLINYLLGLRPDLNLELLVKDAYASRAEDFLEAYYDRMDDQQLRSCFDADPHPCATAASSDSVRMVKYFLQRLPHEIVLGDGKALAAACHHNYEKVAWALLQHIPEAQLQRWKLAMEIQPWEFAAPIDFACLYNWSYEIIELMLSVGPVDVLKAHPEDAPQRLHPIFSTAFDGDINVLRLLIERGGTEQLRFRDFDGNTPLLYLCSSRRKRLTRNSPARQMGRIVDPHKTKCASLVLDLAPELEEQCNHQKNYPIHEASYGGSDLINLLITRPACIELLSKANDDGLYPFNLATYSNTPKSIREVMLHTPSATLQQTCEGMTALHSAVLAQDLTLLDQMLEIVDKSAFDSIWKLRFGEVHSVLDLALSINDEELALQVITRLVDKGGPAQITREPDDCNYSPFVLACIWGSLKVVEYFINVLPEPIPTEVLCEQLEYVWRLDSYPEGDLHEEQQKSIDEVAQMLFLLMRYQLVPEDAVEQMINQHVREKMKFLQAATQKKSAQSQSKRAKESRDSLLEEGQSAKMRKTEF